MNLETCIHLRMERWSSVQGGGGGLNKIVGRFLKFPGVGHDVYIKSTVKKRYHVRLKKTHRYVNSPRTRKNVKSPPTSPSVLTLLWVFIDLYSIVRSEYSIQGKVSRIHFFVCKQLDTDLVDTSFKIFKINSFFYKST